MSEGKWLLISELSEKTGIPESSVRRYTNTFKTFLDMMQKGEEKNFPQNLFQY